MEVQVKRGNISLLNTYPSKGSNLASLVTYIHHELTPEREAELLDFVEKAVIAAVNTFAAA
jgi:hypothetical protein